jgi:hypothetical protein
MASGANEKVKNRADAVMAELLLGYCKLLSGQNVVQAATQNG